MGWFSRTRQTRELVRAADREVTIGTVPPPYTGELAPSIQHRIGQGTEWPFHHRIPRSLALTVPAVRRGVNVYAAAIGSMPLVRRARDGSVLPAGRLLTQPEAHRPYINTMMDLVRDLVLDHRAWWYVTEREWTGYPARVVRLEPEYVQVVTEPGTNEVVETYATYRNKRIQDERNLIRFEGPDEGFLIHGADATVTALRLEDAARRYAEPETPTGVLRNTSQFELTDNEVQGFLDQWERNRRLRNTAFLNAGVEFTSISASPESLQLVEAREESALQIARLLGLPPRYVSATDGSSMTYSNLPSERRELVEISLAPYVGAIEQRLSMPDANGSPLGQSIRFDVEAFTRPSPSERAQIYAQTIPLGVTTVNEARAVEQGTASVLSAPVEVPQ